ncbi:50S ribosomal protein L3 [candidate division WWE3 bacterium CG09_land_8_20_14_0_10_39_24]|uniref:Large ribosomal subunit protein uL3 n=2 Tax=Katanobacteria TaxID=422282 RepID=A0A2G9XBZ4_UNCKA|nr:MAG: 50S ribosomal protein L3 [bacterium CG2_30_40_12]OJI08586.1 MAG: 50S ribosomal protein L3 [bacterium CG09_39_24]PIP04508.1 MAG: 50S ribosomal protein L3 [candidate division WWE3 bacterium CG23_combo_of_CG06-09_8_20_14_all_40_14]PIS12754.1 MAG: 50S ribosomal protein L3 [candidate division WWE3 bacterium CG09_land_8_20_14_0_10_39_24]PJE52133.1 MAG: 50S ribosomal protein L3 [candidate division WWE3 bacterium CG10_big_fil_rev_8_21_14_0_10_39_14]
MIVIEGKKIEMSQIFEGAGKVVPVTLIKIIDKIKEGIIEVGNPVVITGFSKGRGFAGVVKRHNFRGGPATHGQSDRHRAPGSIGAGTSPGRVYKGKRMAGRFGGDKVTVKGFKVVFFNDKENVVAVSGPVPGARNGKVYLKFDKNEN